MRCFFFMVFAFSAVVFAQVVPTINVGEPLAIEIYNQSLPLLEASEILFANGDSTVTFDKIIALAKEKDISTKKMKKLIKSDPYMADYAIYELKRYAKINLAASESEPDKIFAEKLMNAAIEAHRHAAALQILTDNWAPHEKPMKDVR